MDNKQVKSLMILASMAMLIRIRMKIKKPRARPFAWTRPYNREGERRKHGLYHSLIEEARLHDTVTFFALLRMTPTMFETLLQLVGHRIVKQRTSFRAPIEPGARLCITLKFLATGEDYKSLATNFRVGHSTVCKIVRETCIAIYDVLCPLYLRLEDEPHTWEEIAKGFEEVWNFPHCIGAIDGKHISIRAPKNTGSDFHNFKGFFSIVLMAMCDANYCFTFIDIGAYGRESDKAVFSSSDLYRCLETAALKLPSPRQLPGSSRVAPFVIVGDEAFPLKENLLRPYPGRGKGKLDAEQAAFNYRLSRARRVIENAFGILASRWGIMYTTILAQPENAEAFAKACVVLHNFLKKQDSSKTYCPKTYVDQEQADGSILNGDWRKEQLPLHFEALPGCPIRSSQSARAVRDTFTQYFSQEFILPWQEAYVHRTGRLDK